MNDTLNYKKYFKGSRLFNRALIFMVLLFFPITATLHADMQHKSLHPLPANGEILKYNMKFNGLSTAQSIFYTELIDSTLLKINWNLRSKSIFNFLFYVNNHYSSVVDIKSWLPIKLYKKINQKNIKQHFETVFDRKNSIAKTDNGLQWPVKKNCNDILALLYQIRTRKLAPGDTLSYILDIESHVWKVKGAVHKGEKIKGPFQELDIRQINFVFTPELPIIKRKWKTDLFTNRISNPNTKLTICLGPPPENLPVYIKFGSKDTSVEMLLKNVSLKKLP